MTLAADLATLARDNRRGLRSLDATLGADAPVVEIPLVVLANMYAARVAGAVAGVIALAYSVFVLLVWWNPHGIIVNPFDDDDSYAVLAAFDLSRLALLVLLAYALSRRLADRTFDRALRRGRHARMVRSVAYVDRRARVLVVAGATALGSVLTAGWFLFGPDQSWYPNWYAIGAPASAAHIAAAVGLALAIVFAIVVARPRRVMRALARPMAIPVALVIGLAVLTVAFATDPGDLLTAFMQSTEPSQALRFALALTGTLALGALVAAIVERAQPTQPTQKYNSATSRPRV